MDKTELIARIRTCAADPTDANLAKVFEGVFNYPMDEWPDEVHELMPSATISANVTNIDDFARCLDAASLTREDLGDKVTLDRVLENQAQAEDIS